MPLITNTLQAGICNLGLWGFPLLMLVLSCARFALRCSLERCVLWHSSVIWLPLVSQVGQGWRRRPAGLRALVGDAWAMKVACGSAAVLMALLESRRRMPYDATQTLHVSVWLGDNRVVWSEGVSVCLYASPMSSMYLSLLPIYCPCSPRCPWLYLHQYRVNTLPSHSHRRCIGQLQGRTLPALYALQTADAVAPLILQLWHEGLNHRVLDAVELLYNM